MGIIAFSPGRLTRQTVKRKDGGSCRVGWLGKMKFENELSGTIKNFGIRVKREGVYLTTNRTEFTGCFAL